MSSAVVLGDAGASNDDVSYTGDVSASSLSVDWFRTKFLEFQGVLNALDSSYQAGLWVYSQVKETERLNQLLRDYEVKSTEIKALAETLNAGAAAANALGVRMPVLSVPQTLGALPALVVPAAVALAASAVAGWIAYATGYASAMAEAIEEVETTVTDPEERAAVVGALQAKKEQAMNSVRFIASSPIAALAGPLKIAVFAGLAFLGWKAYSALQND